MCLLRPWELQREREAERQEGRTAPAAAVPFSIVAAMSSWVTTGAAAVVVEVGAAAAASVAAGAAGAEHSSTLGSTLTDLRLAASSSSSQLPSRPPSLPSCRG
ncbi:hypothetical protein A4X06_0g7737 [Tilletia controversa]|uniref:Uncharacterized protein n=1 Tax=Tilletia controversa TaxID=13291 RepID=A0A8X7STF5_9BASI|nr:hypothetical protein A4X06_0g7737 [Tilletia controversa]